MKHFMIVYRELAATTDRATSFNERVRAAFPDVVSEYDAGIYVVSTTRSAADVLEAVTPPDAVKLDETLLVLELGSTGAVGCAGSEFIRELGRKVSL